MKKLLALMLLVVTIVILAVPMPALAKKSTNNQAAFLAVAQVAVASPGNVSQEPSEPYKLHTDGEMVVGNIVSAPGWRGVAGADIVFIHSSDTVLDFATMKITGDAVGVIYVGKLAPGGIQPNGKGWEELWLQGTYDATIRGTFSVDENMQVTSYDKTFDNAN